MELVPCLGRITFLPWPQGHGSVSLYHSGSLGTTTLCLRASGKIIQGHSFQCWKWKPCYLVLGRGKGLYVCTIKNQCPRTLSRSNVTPFPHFLLLRGRWRPMPPDSRLLADKWHPSPHCPPFLFLLELVGISKKQGVGSRAPATDAACEFQGLFFLFPHSCPSIKNIEDPGNALILLLGIIILIVRMCRVQCNNSVHVCNVSRSNQGP